MSSTPPPPPPPPQTPTLSSSSIGAAPPPPPQSLPPPPPPQAHFNDPVSEHYHQLHSLRDDMTERPTSSSHHRHRRYESERGRGGGSLSHSYHRGGTPYERSSHRGRGGGHYGGRSNHYNSHHGHSHNSYNSTPKIPTVQELIKETTITTFNGSSFQIPEILNEATFHSRYPSDTTGKSYNNYKQQHRMEILSKIFPIISDGAWFKEVWGPFTTIAASDNDLTATSTASSSKPDFSSFLEKLSNSYFKDFKLSYEKELVAAESIINLDSTTTLELTKSHISPLCPALKEMLGGDQFSPIICLSNIHSSVGMDALENLCSNSIKECDPSLRYSSFKVSEPQLDKSLYRMAWISFDCSVETGLLSQISSLIESNAIGFGGSSDRIYSTVQETLTKKVKVLPAGGGDVVSEMDPEVVFNSIKGYLPLDVVEKILLISKEEQGNDWWWAVDLVYYVCWVFYSINIWDGKHCSYFEQQQGHLLTIRSSKGTVNKDSFENAKSLLERIEFVKSLSFAGSSSSGVVEDAASAAASANNNNNVPSEDAMLEDKWVLKVEEERYKCKECMKLFKGADFVVKHIRGKHEDISKAITMDRLSLTKWLSRPPLWAIAPVSSKSSMEEQRPKFMMRNKPVLPTPTQPPPPSGAHADPRELQKYTDWDAPVIGGDVEISYD